MGTCSMTTEGQCVERCLVTDELEYMVEGKTESAGVPVNTRHNTQSRCSNGPLLFVVKQ